MVFAARLCYAQLNLSGTITDQVSNDSIESAFLKLTNSQNHYETYSEQDGSFNIESIQSGTYTLSVSHIGFKVAVMKLNLSKTQTISVKLERESAFLDAAIISSIRARNTTPSTFTNIDQETIQNLDQSKDFPFLLNTTPSTVVSSDAGNGVGYTGIRVRGIDPTRVNITINGIPLNDGESQGTFWVNLPDLASSTQSVQIQRGVGASTNGAAAFGASVNVRTNDIPKEKYAKAVFAAGSFGTFRTSLSYGSGRLKNNWAFQLRGSVIESEGFIDRASSDLKSANIGIAKYWKKSVFKTNILLGTERTYQAWNGIPQPKFRGDQAELTRYINQLWIAGEDLENLQNSNSNTYNFYTYENEVDNYTQNHYQFFYDHDFSKYLKFNSAAYVTTGKGYFEQFKAGETLADYGIPNEIVGTDTNTEADLVRRRWLDNTLTGGLASLSYEKRKLSVVIGSGYSVYNGRHFGEAIATEFTNYEALNTIYYDNDATKTDGNVYAKVKYKWNNFIPYVDLQFRILNYQFEGLDNTLEFVNHEVRYNFFNPKAGLTYLHRNSSFYAMYAIGNREPVRDDFRDNKPSDWPVHEHLQNVEVGYRFSKGRSRLNVNLYDMTYDNQLVLTGAVNDVGEAVRVNVDDSYRRGVEVDFQVPLGEKLQFGGNATLSENKIASFTEFVGEWDDDFEVLAFEHTNTDISFSPSVIAAAMAGYKINKNWVFDVFGKYVGDQYLDNTQNEGRKLDAFTNVDVSLKYTNAAIEGIKELTMGVYLNNVLNSFYAPNGYTFGGILNGQRANFNYVYPMAGRNVMFKASILF